MFRSLARLAAIAVLALLGGCAMFESDTPMFDAKTGQPVYGAGEVVLRWKAMDPEASDPKSLKITGAFADGAYAFKAKHDGDLMVWRESLHPLAGAPGPDWFVQQAAVTGDETPSETTYYYDLVHQVGDDLWVYQLRCSDLTEEERARFNMVPPSPPPNADGTAGVASSTCMVRSADDVMGAFALLAVRLEPKVLVHARPKRKSWFSRD